VKALKSVQELFIDCFTLLTMRCNPVVTLYVRCIRLYFLILNTFIALIYFNQVTICEGVLHLGVSVFHVLHMELLDVAVKVLLKKVQCFDAVGWAAGRTSGL